MANPFATVGAAAANPFAAAAAPAPAAANPFAATAPAAANPFAAAAATTAAANPFAAATTATTAANPFATTTATTTTTANPFAAATTTTAANPFATTGTAAAANPFAAAGTTTAAANPFAAAGTTATAANPFATAAATTAANPFATAVVGATAQQNQLQISEQLVNDFKALNATYRPDLARLHSYKQFKHILYNLRDPRIDKYTKPPEMSQQEWDKALKTAPDAFGGPDRAGGALEMEDMSTVGRKRARGTEKLVPVALIGFKGLKDRMEQQDRIVTQFAGFAQDLSASLHEMELASQQSKAKIEKLRHKHILLSQRLIRVMEMVDRVLARGMGLDRNEVRLRNRLEAIRERLNRPTEFKARLNELMALQRVHGERRRQRTAFAPGDLRAILDRLKAQRLGLAHLNRIVKRDARDIAIMLRPHKALDVASAADAIRQQRAAGAGAHYSVTDSRAYLT